MLGKRVPRLGVGLAVCDCGHLQSDHSSLLIPLGEKMFREYNHGGCVECDCQRFTFNRFVSLEEAAELHKEAHSMT